jgi:hypothetical protein
MKQQSRVCVWLGSGTTWYLCFVVKQFKTAYTDSAQDVVLHSVFNRKCLANWLVNKQTSESVCHDEWRFKLCCVHVVTEEIAVVWCKQKLLRFVSGKQWLMHAVILKIKYILKVGTYIPIYIQQDATLHNLFTSGNCSTCFGWWYHQKHVEQFPDINKLCKVASCWIYIGIYLRCTDP